MMLLPALNRAYSVIIALPMLHKGTGICGVIVISNYNQLQVVLVVIKIIVIKVSKCNIIAMTIKHITKVITTSNYLMIPISSVAVERLFNIAKW